MRRVRFKIFILLLATVILSTTMLPLVGMAASEDLNSNVVEFNDEYFALKGMGFIDEELDATQSNGEITRAQFIGILFNMAGYDKVIYNSLDIPFIDVNENTPYKDAIYTMYKQGIINGASDNQFLPNNGIRQSDAIKVILDVLGYKPYVYARSGEYPFNYEVVASNLNLLSSIPYSRNDFLTVNQAAALLYKAGSTATMDVSAIENENMVYDTDSETLLSRYHNIYYKKGVLQANGMASLVTQNVDKDTAIIGGVLYKNKELDLSRYLGYEVSYFYQEFESERTLLWVTPTKNTNSLLITYDKLAVNDSRYGLNQIVYYNNEKEIIVKIDDFASIIYNNSLYNDATVDKIKPQSGSILLINNDGDNKYDVVIVLEYTNIFVSSVSVIGEFIADKYGNTIYLEQYNDYKIFKDGKSITLAECPTNVVLSYVETRDQKDIYMYINGVGITDTLDETSVVDGETYLSFSDVEYTLSNQFKQLLQSGNYKTVDIKAGNTYKYYLDIDGNIAEMTDEVDNQIMYAYVIGGRVNDRAFAASNSALFKVLAENGEMITAPTAKKVKIDDTSGLTGSSLLNDSRLFENGTIKEQVVIIKFNKDGEICEFDFAEDLDNNGFPYDTSKFTKDYSTTTGYYNKDMCEMINYKYYVSQSTICFAKYTNVNLEDEYRVIKRDKITQRKDYKITVYDCDETMKAGAITIEINGTQLWVDGHVLVDDVRRIHEDGESRLRITGYNKAKKVVYTELSENLITEDIKRGDILRVSLVDDKLASVQKVCRLSDRPLPFLNLANSNAQPGGDEFTQIFGYLYSKGENTLVTLNPENSPFGKLSVTSFKGSLTIPIMVYDNRTDTVYMGTLNDLYQIATPDSEGNLYISENSVRVFIYRRYNYAQEIIVVYY